MFTYNGEWEDLAGYIFFNARFSGSGYGPVFCSSDGSFGGKSTGATLLQMK